MKWLALALTVIAFPAAAQTSAPALDVTGGRIAGEKLADGTFAFKAIPFAAPPVGDLRWAPPLDPVPWTGVRQKHDSAPACLQMSYGWNADLAKTSDEDCLYLEVRTPSLDPHAKLPVLVFIHGGANRAGGATGTIMTGFPSRGVIIVSIPYRLGVFGFLSHPALTAEQHGASGNYALMDQIKALEWVRDNIAKFGGDPANVTIDGHSAGAQDVGLLLVSPLARGLFAKAIEESGPPQFGLPPRTLAQNEAMGADLAKQYAAPGHAPDSAEALADLRHAPAIALQETADKLPVPIADSSFIWLQAVVDGRVLPKSPKTLFKTGQQARVPLLIGVSAQELGLSGGDAAIYPTVDAAFGHNRMKVLRFYGLDVSKTPKADPVLGPVAMQLSTDLMMRCPSSWVAAHVTAGGQRAWLYQLDVDSTGGTVHHGSELAFVFNAAPPGKTQAQWPSLLDYWANFARSGDPNGDAVAAWPDFGGARRFIEFSPDGPVVKRDMRGEVCRFRDQP